MLRDFKSIEKLFDELFPICRSITGPGYMKSLEILSKYIPFKIQSVETGTKVFDWTVPKEWKINDGYIICPDGSKIANFKTNNLSVINYSAPIDKTISLNELQNHLHSIPESPDAIPYVTSYYKEQWGFCLKDKIRKDMQDGEYRVIIDSEFYDGSVKYGSYTLKGSPKKFTKKTVLLSSYLCHPSMANNELSGPIFLAAIYQRLLKWDQRNFDYLFVVNPETIGSICFLSEHGLELKTNMQAGLVMTCLGGPHKTLTYKLSRAGNSTMDKLFLHLEKEGKCLIRKFDPSIGGDERQYCSSGFNLPVGQISKTVYGKYSEYHTSLDDKKFVELEDFLCNIDALENILKIHDNMLPLNREEPYCEMQLGKRGLYPNTNSPSTWTMSSDKLNDEKHVLKIISYILSYADGDNDLVDIANLSENNIDDVLNAYNTLKSKMQFV